MRNKIKIAFFAEILIEDFDGASRTIFQIIRRIPVENFEFIFFCGIPPETDFPFEVVKVTAITIPFNNNYKMAVPFFDRKKIQQKMMDFKPDVIHISTPSLLGKFALEYGWVNKIPVITIYHTHFISYIDYYLEHIGFMITPVRRVMIKSLKLFYEKCDMMYVPTKVMELELAKINISGAQMKIWPRGLNTSAFNPSKKNIEYIRKLSGNKKPNILFASRLVWEKNLKTLIEIYKKSESSGNPFNFIIAGDGVAKSALKDQMPNAVFLGKLDHEQLAVVYASCDIFLFTSVTETFGNVVVEAMASGLPCVIAHGGGSAGLIENGENGFLCAPDQADNYLDKIHIILQDDTLRSVFIERGLYFAHTLNWESLTNTYFEDLQTLALNPIRVEGNSVS